MNRSGGGSDRNRSPFPDTEADTGKIDQRMVMFAKLAHTFDHFPPGDATSFVELAEAIGRHERERSQIGFRIRSETGQMRYTVQMFTPSFCMGGSAPSPHVVGPGIVGGFPFGEVKIARAVAGLQPE